MTRLPCFKSYDVRGRLGADLNEALVYRIGRAFARVFQPALVVTGRDIRESIPALQAALIEGLRDESVAVIDLGLCGTEEVYFATDYFGAGGGLMVTASHNPVDYNGIKLVREGARPISSETGLTAIHDMVLADNFGPTKPLGVLRRENPRDAYADRVISSVDIAGLKPLKIVVNAGNGTAGPAFDVIAERLNVLGLPFAFHTMNHNPDSGFPNGIPNPLLPENRPQTARVVVAEGADIGVAWDGDFDRCFFFDEKGAFIDGEYVVALLAQAFLAKEPGARIVHDPRVVWNAREVIAIGGGKSVVCRTGHAHLKAKMREFDAVYGGEMSAHHYFRAFMYCDSGQIPWLLVSELLSRYGQSLSTLVDGMRTRFPSSGEINFAIDDKQSAIARFETKYLPHALSVDRLDGVSLDMGDWRVNLRSSNTENVLRLNVETKGDRALLDAKVAELSAVLEG